MKTHKIKTKPMASSKLSCGCCAGSGHTCGGMKPVVGPKGGAGNKGKVAGAGY